MNRPRISPIVKEHSRSLRGGMTDAERLFWHHVRLRQVGGVKFRRQHPIGKCIADFACIEAKLVIEIDGGQHADAVVQDAARTKALEREGYRVLRFWNNEVLQNIAGVIDMVSKAVAERPPPSQPSPSKGEGDI